MSATLHYHRREKATGLDPEKSIFSDIYVSPMASETSRVISEMLREMRQTIGTPTRHVGIADHLEGTRKVSTAEALFDARAAVKVMTSRVAMHLDDAWRRILFRKIDDLLDAEDWNPDDVVLKAGSFQTYLRFHLLVRPSKEPNFGISDEGNLLAGWITGTNRLSMEFLPEDTVRWVLVRYVDDERETAAAQVSLPRLREVLAPFDPHAWWS